MSFKALLQMDEMDHTTRQAAVTIAIKNLNLKEASSVTGEAKDGKVSITIVGTMPEIYSAADKLGSKFGKDRVFVNSITAAKEEKKGGGGEEKKEGGEEKKGGGGGDQKKGQQNQQQVVFVSSCPDHCHCCEEEEQTFCPIM